MSLSDLLSNEREDYQKVLLSFMTQPCKVTTIQNPVIKEPSLIVKHQLSKRCSDAPACIYFHNYEERRRRIVQENSQTLIYNSEPCPAFLSKFLCDDADSCPFSHSNSEIVYHPSMYKTQECLLKSCPFDKVPHLCPNLHPKEPSRAYTARLYDEFASRAQQSFGMTKGRTIMNLNSFKTSPCTKKTNHEKKICPYYHNEMDKRRPTTQYNYCFEMCNKISQNHCSCDLICLFAKNKVEQLYHPEKYKKKFCEHYPYSIQKCDYGDFCSFAHNEGEIRTELFFNEKQNDEFNMYKLKTVFCPFKNDHDRGTCPYAHNVQDYRRNPLMYKYEPEECPNWSKGESVTSYDQPGCTKMLDCDKCHGWKEYEYHPQVYKTRTCSNGAKCPKKDCAYHHSKDKRSMTKVTSPLGEKQIKNCIGQFGAANLFKQDFSFEPREKKAASNFMRPMVASYIPIGSKYQDMQQLQQENSELSHLTISTMGQFLHDSNNLGNQQHGIQSTSNSLTSACHASLLQESYSTRYNSGVSSAKESSEDETMHENSQNKTPSLKKARGFSPQSASSEKTFEKSKNRKPLKISKKNQSFVPSGTKEEFDEYALISHSKSDQNSKDAGSFDLQKKFQSRSNTPDSSNSATKDTRSMSYEAFQNPGIFIQPRFPSYGANTFSNISLGMPTIIGSKSKEASLRAGDPFQSLYTTPFDIDELKPTNNKTNYKTSFPADDSEPIVLGKFIEDNTQNDEEDLKLLLNEIDQYAGKEFSFPIKLTPLI